MHVIQVYREKRNIGFPNAAKVIRKAAKVALREQNVDCDCIVNVLLTDSNGIQAINVQQRGIDAPTDVLSFPLNELTEGNFDSSICEFDYETEKCLLGDMVLNLERCEEQAKEYGHSFEHEVSYLTVHSILHLLGYDHLDEGKRKKAMRAQEKHIMKALMID